MTQPTARSTASVAPAEAGATVSAPVDLASICAQWSEFTQVVQQTKAMLAHCLSEGTPKFLEGTLLQLEFPSEHTFHMNLLREPSTLRELEEQLHTYFGQRMKVTLHEEGTAGAAADVAAPRARLTQEDIAQSRLAAAEDVLERNPRVQEILDAFDGEILEDNES